MQAVTQHSCSGTNTAATYGQRRSQSTHGTESPAMMYRWTHSRGWHLHSKHSTACLSRHTTKQYNKTATTATSQYGRQLCSLCVCVWERA